MDRRRQEADDRSDGIDALRRERGAQTVTFDDVADHLVDYIERRPESRGTLDRFAGFLAGVETVEHDHDLDPDHGLPQGDDQEPTPPT